MLNHILIYSNNNLKNIQEAFLHTVVALNFLFTYPNWNILIHNVLNKQFWLALLALFKSKKKFKRKEYHSKIFVEKVKKTFWLSSHARRCTLMCCSGHLTPSTKSLLICCMCIYYTLKDYFFLPLIYCFLSFILTLGLLE